MSVILFIIVLAVCGLTMGKLGYDIGYESGYEEADKDYWSSSEEEVTIGESQSGTTTHNEDEFVVVEEDELDEYPDEDHEKKKSSFNRQNATNETFGGYQREDGRWVCDVCADDFANKRGLSVHYGHMHRD